MKYALLLLLLAANAAADPRLVAVELERDQLGSRFSRQLPAAEGEPGGLLVPVNPDPLWTSIGLQAGDVIRYTDGRPATGRVIFHDGSNLLEIDRKGLPMIYRVLIRGPAVQLAVVRQTELVELVARLADPDPHTTVVRRNGHPAGVRLIDLHLTFKLQIELGDIVRTIDGHPILSDAAFVAALQNLRAGATLIEVERHGRPITIEVTREPGVDLGTIKRTGPRQFDVPRSVVTAIEGDLWLPSFKTEAIAVMSRGKATGLRVYQIELGSLCAAIGLQDDDIILDVEGSSIATLADGIQTIQRLSDAKHVRVKIERKGKRFIHTYRIRES